MAEHDPGYCELHACSAFSFLRGASAPEELAAVAGVLDLPAVALCDRNGFYGSPRFHTACRAAGVRAVVGCELVMENGAVLPVLVENRSGYRNLSRLLTRAHLRAPKGEARVQWDELGTVGSGVVALTGDKEGPLRVAWRAGGAEGAAATLAWLRDCFGADGLYVELQRHGLRGEARWNNTLVALAESHRLPLLATHGVRYATPAGREVQDVFTCLRERTTLDAAGRRLSCNAERALQSAAAMRARFSDHPEAVAVSVELAERLTFSLENLGYAFPEYPVPSGESMDSFLAKMTWFGAEQRYGGLTPAVRRQLERELALIRKLGFSGYFLVVWDIVNFCREHGILVQGRGSAANSAVCYSLGITAVDPVGNQLLFERFLSEGRRSWPDIDLDLPSGGRREQVIREVYRRYAPRGAAMTANVICYRSRSVVREVGKVLGFPEEALNRFSNLYAGGDYPNTLARDEQLERAGISADHPRTRVLLDLCERIHGLPRHLGQHSGGMIICRDHLDSVVPLENASMPGRVVAQWDKEDCENLGIVKVDLLGLGMMSALQDSLAIARERGHVVDFAHIPKDDPATYELLRAADTVGVFQVESRAQMATLPRLKPCCFYDLAIEVAIVRPGPIVGRLAHPYLERRAGREPVDYIHEKLRPTLERTLGVPLFQEQVLKMAMVLADFSGAEAEELRRALGFNKGEERMRGVEERLRQALRERGYGGEVIEKVCRSIRSFALYGFPESHAISFALIAYASAYLKVHYPAEFYVGLLNNQPMGFYSSATLIRDARRHGLRFLAPCVAESGEACAVVDDRVVRLGLNMIRGVRAGAIATLLDERTKRPFQSLADLRRRTRFRDDELRALAAAGALNVCCGNRRAALWAVAKAEPVDDLFARVAEETGEGRQKSEDGPCPLRAMSPHERLQSDYTHTGVSVSWHPMAWMRSRLSPRVRRASELPGIPSGSRVAVAGTVICRQRPGTAKGVVFVSLEDETGIANSIVSAALFERRRLVITQERFLLIIGELQNAEGVIHIKARRIEGLPSGELPHRESHDFR